MRFEQERGLMCGIAGLLRPGGGDENELSVTARHMTDALAYRGPDAAGYWTHAPAGYYLILTDQPGDKTWPILASTFVLMHKAPTDKAASAEAVKFFKFAFEKGGKAAEDLDYIPMPDSVVKLIEKTWSADIKS